MNADDKTGLTVDQTCVALAQTGLAVYAIGHTISPTGLMINPTCHTVSKTDIANRHPGLATGQTCGVEP